MPKRTYIRFVETDSTNNELKKMIYASKYPVGTVVSADRQLNGKGRLGRSFISPLGGVYFSASYPLKKDAGNIPFITLSAGLAVSDVIEQMSGCPTHIKWPNDIYISDRKVCGILTELVSVGDSLTAVVGIGINNAHINPDDPALVQKITSLHDEGIFIDSEELIRKIVARLDRLIYEKNVLSYVTDDILIKLNNRSYLIGKNVEFTHNGVLKSGTAGKTRADGALEIIMPGEENIFVKFGEVSIKNVE